MLDDFFHSLLSKKLKGPRDDPIRWRATGVGDSKTWTLDLDDNVSESAAWLSHIHFRTPEKMKADYCGKTTAMFIADCFESLPETYMAKADSSTVTLPKEGMIKYVLINIGTRRKALYNCIDVVGKS